MDETLPVHEITDNEINEFCKSDPNGKIKSGAPIKPKTNATRVRCYGKGIEPTGNLVDAPTKFFVETFTAGNGDVDVIIINPKGQKEPVI